jgi:hypothetical protein
LARYSVTSTKAGVNTANTIMWQLRAAATQRVWLLELGVAVSTGPPTTNPQFRLNRPTAVGTSTATVTPQSEDPGNAAAVTLLDTTWSANPTLGGTDLRSFPVPASIGAGLVWTWYDAPFVIPVSGGLCIVNGNATGATLGSFSIYAYFNE